MGRYFHKWSFIIASNCCSFIIINTLRLRQNGRHFPDNIFKWIFVNENVWILIKVSLKFVPKGSIDNNPAPVQIMAWRRIGDKPLSEPMLTWFTDAYMRTRWRWVNTGQNSWVFADNIWKALSWIKMIIFWFKSKWIVFGEVDMTISQHWFR